MNEISFQKFIKQDTATFNDKNVKEFSTKLSLEPAIEVKVDYKNFPDSKMLECYENVENVVKKFGGNIYYGWILWQNYIYLDAEFHAIWKKPDGTLLDVTPQPDGEKLIVFVPDNTINYRGFPIRNRRFPCIKSENVNKLLELYNSVSRPSIEIQPSIKGPLLLNIYKEFISSTKS